MKRNKHNLSNYKLFSCDMGELIPCGYLEVLPGDSVQHATSLLIRTQPLLAPLMHRVDVRIHHWYVPFRLIWDEFQDFITGGPTGTSVPTPPQFIGGGWGGSWAVGSLGDYLGYPISTAAPVNFSALPVRAYNLIYNEWYRDQDLQTPLTVSKASGTDNSSTPNLQKVSWEKDYFTSSRPWEQKGPTITLPLGTTAPVLGIGNAVGVTGAAGPLNVYRTGTNVPASFLEYYDSNAGPGRVVMEGATISGTDVPNVRADLSNASAITVTRLREALALQRFEEARARFGSRYTEYLRYLGVASSDARLQRPEYLGGGKQALQFSEVLQTAADGANAVGTMRGHGITGMRSNRYRRFIEEHGCIISMLSARPKTMYMQTLPRAFNRLNKEDFWQKELEAIGQQEVLASEVMANGSGPNDIFGYQDRYDEYRRQENTVAGEFRTTTLNFWHMARDFTVQPVLNSNFVTCTPTKRNFPVTAQDVLYVMARHSLVARRLVAKTGRSFTF